MQQADGSWTDVPVKTVAIGQTVRVKPGRTHRPDGVVTIGRSSVNQAPITGESLPVEKSVGDRSSPEPLTSPVPSNTKSRLNPRIRRWRASFTRSRSACTRAHPELRRSICQGVHAGGVRLRPGGGAGAPVAASDGGWYDWIYRRWFCWSLPARAPGHFDARHHRQVRRRPPAMASLIKGGVYLEEGDKLAWLALDKTGTITHGKPAMTDAVLLDAPAGLMPFRSPPVSRRDPITPFLMPLPSPGEKTASPLLEVADLPPFRARGARNGWRRAVPARQPSAGS